MSSEVWRRAYEIMEGKKQPSEMEKKFLVPAAQEQMTKDRVEYEGLFRLEGELMLLEDDEKKANKEYAEIAYKLRALTAMPTACSLIENIARDELRHRNDLVAVRTDVSRRLKAIEAKYPRGWAPAEDRRRRYR